MEILSLFQPTKERRVGVFVGRYISKPRQKGRTGQEAEVEAERWRTRVVKGGRLANRECLLNRGKRAQTKKPVTTEGRRSTTGGIGIGRPGQKLSGETSGRDELDDGPQENE
ncbi:predicted protein [Histoplasma capsulatum G186AR]|uniref:Uncharacterized protein n=1 Tax=Ajellomyces capsulatus (strain G186AR / H82 / ATCC MYA-2454 / RMSCC 2432) TaxID=447093 RepID=C0P0T3_AJECG|nr:uncharacterized protein HCBG_09013 [Histoplasma capsulatum G186AR]EEH02733.1 predicted protein [Histoplasma capsulatum G186AR]